MPSLGGDRSTVEHYLALDCGDRSPELVAEIRRLMVDYGSIEVARAYAAGIADAALAAFDGASAGALDGPATDFLRALIPFMLRRRS